MKHLVVAPCFNEEDDIDKLKIEFSPAIELPLGGGVDNGQADSIEIISVDDGSRDSTYDVLKNAFGSYAQPSIMVKFEKHVISRGQGAAMRTGFGAVNENIIVTTYSDGIYKSMIIPSMLERLESKLAIITASPYHSQGEVIGVPGYRVFLSQGLSLLYCILLRWKVHTYNALYRACRQEVIDEISFTVDKFLGGIELVAKAMLKGYQMDEFPAALHSRMFGILKA